MSRLLFVIVALCFATTVRAWVSPSIVRNRITSSSSMLNAIEVVSLESLENHEEDGTAMAASIVAWLDDEWIPQEVHVRLAESAKASYIACRENGENDIMSVMMRIADDMEKNWAAYDKDAFVNQWDIANYVSDYLTKVSGAESCDCSSEIF
mmetsp:Transcript_13287/g.20708  ORF Transcript_13287/g.20708 Transcript_13287/m.20708 type:complete len:152 (+) Transcript_13287:75-530(+)